MPWQTHLGHFFGGVFLANSLPHLIAGVSGLPLQTPFASPPFRGLSSPVVNVAWALINLAAAYLLLFHLAPPDLTAWSDFAGCFAGFGLMALQCARALTLTRKTPTQ